MAFFKIQYIHIDLHRFTFNGVHSRWKYNWAKLTFVIRIHMQVKIDVIQLQQSTFSINYVFVQNINRLSVVVKENSEKK